MTPQITERDALVRELEGWQATGQLVDAAIEALQAVGMSIESPAVEVMQEAFDLATAQLAARAGDASDWLDWYSLDNDWGRSGHQVRVDGQDRAIDSVQALADLLIEFRETAEAEAEAAEIDGGAA